MFSIQLHQPLHAELCERSTPINWNGQKCMDVFRNYWFYPTVVPYLTRLYRRIREVIKLDLDPNSSFESDLEVGEMGFGLHRRGGG